MPCHGAWMIYGFMVSYENHVVEEWISVRPRVKALFSPFKQNGQMIHRFEALSLLIHMNSVVTGFEWTILCNSQSNIMSSFVKNVRFVQQHSEHGLVIDLQMFSKHIECITKEYCRTLVIICNMLHYYNQSSMLFLPTIKNITEI